MRKTKVQELARSHADRGAALHRAAAGATRTADLARRRATALLRAAAGPAKKEAKAPEAAPLVAEHNESADFVAAGVTPKGRSAAAGRVELVGPHQAYHAPQGMELKCFLHRDGSAVKFAGKLGALHLIKEQAQAEFGPLIDQARPLFAAHPAPGAGGPSAPAKTAKPVHRDAAGSAAGAGLEQVPAALAAANGRPLDAATRRRMEQATGADLGAVRVHTDAQADRAAREINAHAFVHGQDVFFRGGRYEPHSKAGRELLAHELTHTVQQKATPPAAPPPSEFRISQPGDAVEREADAVARGVARGQAAPPAVGPDGAAAPVLARAPANAPPPATPAPPGGPKPAAGGGRPIELLGAPAFVPPAEAEERLATAGGAGARVPVRVGGLAAGELHVRKAGDKYSTVGGGQGIGLSHPALAGRQFAGLSPVLVVKVEDDVVTGYASVGTVGRQAPKGGLAEAIQKAPEVLGWAGMHIPTLPVATNQLEGGTFRFELKSFPFDIGNVLHGTATFGLTDETATFNATATVRVPRLDPVAVEIRRDDAGNLKADVAAGVQLPKFSGAVKVHYEGGAVTGEGTVGYQDEKFGGEVTLLVTDADRARDIAREKLPPENIKKAAAPAAPKEAGRPGPRGVCGFGTLNFSFTEWLTGRADVVVDGAGHVTVVGEIKPQAQVELLPQKDYIKDIITIEVRAPYGVPLVGNVFLFANVGLKAAAKLGPAVLKDVVVKGTYSTDANVKKDFSIQGTLNFSAYAGLILRAEGGAGLEILGHDIKAGVGVQGLAGIRGYAEATPTLGYRETGGPKGEFFLKGHLEVAAQPFVSLSGDLFVKLVSPWWSPAPSKTWTWPIGSLEYPLPGQFGIGADVDYVIGSGKLPEIQFGSVDFNADRFLTDLADDHAPKKSGPAERENKGTFKEGEAGAGAKADKEPKPKDSKGKPPAKPAKGGGQRPQDGDAPKKDKERPWLEGMKAIGELQERSQKTPFTKEEIDGALKSIRRKFGFTVLRADDDGADWVVDAEMNPKTAERSQKRRVRKAAKAAKGGEPAVAVLRIPSTATPSQRAKIKSLVAELQRRGHAEDIARVNKILREDYRDNIEGAIAVLEKSLPGRPAGTRPTTRPGEDEFVNVPAERRLDFQGSRVVEKPSEIHALVGEELHHAFFNYLRWAIKKATGRGLAPSGKLSRQTRFAISTADHREIHRLWDDVFPSLSRRLDEPNKTRNASAQISALIDKGPSQGGWSIEEIVNTLVRFYEVVLKDYPHELRGTIIKEVKRIGELD